MNYLFKKNNDRRYEKQRKPVKVGDKEYDSVLSASRDLDVSSTTVRNRLRAGQSKDGTIYIYLKKK